MLRAVITGAAIVVLAVAGAVMAPPIPGAQPAAASAAGSRIEIHNFSFTPAAVTVPVGTTVTWVNHDDGAHTVTGDDGRFASGAFDHDKEFSYQFTGPGTHAYHCAIHPHLTARIIVK
jgi:plastocyanin